MRSAGQLAAVVLVAALVAAAPASAHAARLSGQIIGQPYAAKKRTAVLVLLDEKSRRRAKLNSRLGELRVAAKKVKAPGGRRIAPRLLRINDRFRARARVRRGARRASHWRITSRKLAVTKRSKTLSAAELEELVTVLRGDLSKLGATVQALARYTMAEFAAVRAEMASMRADLNALRSEFTALAAQVAAADAALQAQIDALSASVNALAADLAELQADLAALTGELAALSATVAALSEELLAGVAPGAIADALGDIATLQSDVAGLQTDVAALCGPTSLLDALC